MENAFRSSANCLSSTMLTDESRGNFGKLTLFEIFLSVDCQLRDLEYRCRQTSHNLDTLSGISAGLVQK